MDTKKNREYSLFLTKFNRFLFDECHPLDLHKVIGFYNAEIHAGGKIIFFTFTYRFIFSRFYSQSSSIRSGPPFR